MTVNIRPIDERGAHWEVIRADMNFSIFDDEPSRAHQSKHRTQDAAIRKARQVANEDERIVLNLERGGRRIIRQGN